MYLVQTHHLYSLEVKVGLRQKEHVRNIHFKNTPAFYSVPQNTWEMVYV